MITLSELRSICENIFPGKKQTYIKILFAWAKHDPQGYLNNLFSKADFDTTKLIRILSPMVEENSENDSQLLSQYMTRIRYREVNGYDLLTILCQYPENELSKKLKDGGLNFHKLSDLINYTNHIKESISQYGLKVYTKSSPLLQFSRDLTEEAKKGLFEHLYECPESASRLYDVLLRRNKRNIALTGSAGVGKTSQVEILARSIIKEIVPLALRNFRIFEISMSKVVAGTIYRGQFEERFNKILEAAEAIQPNIIFIDEMHLIWGAGRAEGVITDAANILKPFLSKGLINIIGATTVEEYQRYIVRDEALARRFQEIRLNEPDKKLTLKILENQVLSLEKHHNIKIPGRFLEQTIELTNRHLPNRYQPDKSIDLLDSASVNVAKEGRTELEATDLFNLLAKLTGKPLATLTGEDKYFLREMVNKIKERIIGQDNAVEKVALTIIQRRQDLGAENRNLGTFLFAGNSGVGKTELARTIAELFFGNKKLFLHLDLVEYNLPSSLHKLLGVPSGYTGAENEGVLPTWLHTYNSGVILFDEIEKSHTEIQNALLGMLDNGRISSANGKQLDTRQYVIVLTTNTINSETYIRKNVGFGEHQRSSSVNFDLLKDYFPKEFLARLDEIIVFNSLGDKEVRKILKLKLNNTLAKLKNKGIQMHFDEKRLLDHLMQKLNNNKIGARGIERLLDTELLQPIAIKMLEDDETVIVELDDEYYSNKIIK